MSVFGGDSWAREAQHRKRRVDDFLLEELDASSYKKLSNGKYACLICPKNPILDTLITLSTHVKGSCHRAAESRRGDRELARKEQISKAIALGNFIGASALNKQRTKTAKPLIEITRKVSSEVVSVGVNAPVLKNETGNFAVPHVKASASNGESSKVEAVDKGFDGKVQQLDYRELRERELKFTAAGWKRDCHGSWFKDENVEFDSDEEDPNFILNDSK